MRLSFKSLLFCCISLSCALQSCESEFDSIVKVPPASPYVTCYLTNAKDKILLYYKTAISVNETGQYGNVGDASIMLDNNLISQPMVYDSIKQYYSLDTSLIPLVRGQSYNLKITNIDGSQMLAQTTIPTYTVPPFNYTASNNSNKYFFSYNFNDTSQSDTYYLFQCYSKVPCQTTGCTDTLYFFLNNIVIHKEKDIHSVNAVKSFTIHPVLYNFMRLGESYGLLIEPFAINQDMYYYFTSFEANVGSQTGGTTYTSPAPVYSNFDIGNGILGPVMKN